MVVRTGLIYLTRYGWVLRWVSLVLRLVGGRYSIWWMTLGATRPLIGAVIRLESLVSLVCIRVRWVVVVGL